MSEIASSIITFHNKKVGFQYTSELYEKFGVFELEMAQTPMTKDELFIHSTNDVSGSMQDASEDGRSKMQHLHLTLENIMRLLSSNADDLAVTLEISGFDDTIVEVLQPTKMTSDVENMQKIINTVKAKLFPRNSTNIGNALQHASRQLQMQENAEKQKSLIFMTDGLITAGTSDIELLKSYTPNISQNYFIGFGADHDYVLLQQLASVNNGSYYYVDKIENAGLVFGEIIHSILYTMLRNVKIQVTNGSIYDYTTNQWVSEIQIPNLCSEAKKTFHVRSSNPAEFELRLIGTSHEYQPVVYTECSMPDLVDTTTGEIGEVDCTKYIYRQKVMELLFETATLAKKEHAPNEEKNKQKTVLSEFRKQIEAYATEPNIDEETKTYLKQLTDDLFISEKTLNSQKALLYTTVRLQAQGREASYNMTQVEYEEDDQNDTYRIAQNPLTPHTSNTQGAIMRSCSDNTRCTPEMDYENLPPPTQSQNRQTQNRHKIERSPAFIVEDEGEEEDVMPFIKRS